MVLKLRIIGYQSTTGCTDCYITIDGVTEKFSQNSTSYAQASLNYEKTGLEAKIHEVVLYSNNTNNSNYGLIFDAVDVDGYLLNYYQPTNLVATSGANQVNLNWDAVDGATSYNIKRLTTASGPYETIATSSAITFTDSEVTPGTTYYYVVSAVVTMT